MKPTAGRLCAIALLTIQTAALAQKTEVSVRKGKVIAETETASVAVEAGRKAVLAPGKDLTVAVDDPMVDDVMEIYKWVEEERQANKQRIDTTSILVYRVDGEHLLTLAYLAEIQNSGTEPSDKCRMGPTSILEEPKYYDLEGNLLAFDLEKIDARTGYYTLRFADPVEPGQNFKYVSVSRFRSSVFKVGRLRYLRPNWNVPNCLNYCRFILPESAIFVDASRPVTMVDSFDGKVAVTCRAYTGPAGDGTFCIAFLWPDKDGSSLADLPPRYRGLRDRKEEAIIQVGRLETAKILAGEVVTDQSDPLTTLLSVYSAVVHRDREVFVGLIADPVLKGIAFVQFDRALDLFGSATDEFGFLSTPDWPEEPEDGYIHPIRLCRKGSLLCEATVTMIYRDGERYINGVTLGVNPTGSTADAARRPSGGTTITRGQTDLNAAAYKGLEPGKFMTRWLLLGPVPIKGEDGLDGSFKWPDDDDQRRAFAADSLDVEHFSPKVTIGDAHYEWASLRSEYGVVDLTDPLDDLYVIAYAWAQIEMAEETNGFLGIGSDDGVKVWLNGELVHENWVVRGASPDSDRVPVTFKKGKNQLVLKIQNGGGPWGFSCRLLNE